MRTALIAKLRIVKARAASKERKGQTISERRVLEKTRAMEAETRVFRADRGQAAVGKR